MIHQCKMAELPDFVKDHIESYGPDDAGITYQARQCDLRLIAEGLAAGVVVWSDKTREANVFYESRLWGEYADRLAPRVSEDGSPIGGVGAFMHHRCNEPDSHLGVFVNVMDSRGSTAIDLANRLARMKGEPEVKIEMPEDNSLLGRLYRERMQRNSE